jgi:putative membrane protein
VGAVMYDGGGWIWHDGWGWGGWILMALAMIVFWAVVISSVVLAVRYPTSDSGRSAGPQPGPTANRAEDVLAERYARGEIDDDEYGRRLTLLREHR